MNIGKNIHFEISERKILLRLIDVFVVLFALNIVSSVFEFDYFNISTTNFYWTIVLGIYITIVGSLFELYNLQVASSQFKVIKSIILTSSTTVLVYLLTPFYTPILPSNRFQILIFFISIFGALFFWRMIYVHFFALNRFHKKAILICDVKQFEDLLVNLEKADPHYKILGFVCSDNFNEKEIENVINININDIEKFVIENAISEIVIASQKSDGITVNLYNQLINLLEKGYNVKEYTEVYESITQRIPVQFVSRDFYTFFPFSRSNENQFYIIIVRILEIIVSIIGLVIGSFLLPFIALGNFFGNKGQLFYTQERVGKNGKVFKIIKFRTMIHNAEGQGPVFASVNDKRVTDFGKILRKTRIDEFPQFYNILKGDMAVIGPRPERPFFVKEIELLMPFYETRHVIKPGLTGWAQVNYSYGATLDDSLIKLQYDLYYIKHRSLFLDFNIMFKTLTTVLFYRGQ